VLIPLASEAFDPMNEVAATIAEAIAGRSKTWRAIAHSFRRDLQAGSTGS
jgi:hypothetical protein